MDRYDSDTKYKIINNEFLTHAGYEILYKLPYKHLITKDNIDETHSKGKITALMVACMLGDIDTVEYLIDAGANVNFHKKGNTALNIVCNYVIIQHLYEQFQNINYTKIASILLKHGADPDFVPIDETKPVTFANYNLAVAAMGRSDSATKLLELLLSYGANPNPKYSALISASMYPPGIPQMKVLLKYGADPNTAVKYVSRSLDDSPSENVISNSLVVHLCSISKSAYDHRQYEEAIRLLLEYGATYTPQDVEKCSYLKKYAEAKDWVVFSRRLSLR